MPGCLFLSFGLWAARFGFMPFVSGVLLGTTEFSATDLESQEGAAQVAAICIMVTGLQQLLFWLYVRGLHCHLESSYESVTS